MWEGGLARIDLSTDKSYHYRSDPTNDNSIGSQHIFAFLEDSSKQLWIGTWGGGLSLYDRTEDHFTSFPKENFSGVGTSDHTVTTILGDSQSTLWLGTDSFGLNSLSKETSNFRYFITDRSNPYSISNNTINCLYRNSKQRLWIATRHGLNVLDEETGKFHLLSIEDGLPSNVIYGILEDDQGYLWLSTGKGLSRIKATFHNNRLSAEIHNFGPQDGLLNNKYNRWSYCRTRDGMLIFGGPDGVDFFYPEQANPKPFFPPIVFTEFSLLNTPITELGLSSPLLYHINQAKNISLRHTDRMFSIQFAALGFMQSHRINYAYKLEGFDESWNFIGQQRKATYTNINPGNYTFRVKSTNNVGEWSTTEATIQIFIKPPYYQTKPFIALAIIFFVGFIVAVFRFRTAALRVHAIELEKKVHEKTADIVATNRSLKKSEERFRNLIEDINEVVFSTDTDGVLTYLSPAVEASLGYTNHEMIGKKLADFVFKEDLPHFLENHEKMLKTQSGEIDFRIVDKDVTFIWVRLSEKMAFSGKTHKGSRGLITNINERKLLQTQLVQAQKLESIGQLAAGIAHEINTPSQYVGDNIAFVKDAFESYMKFEALNEALIKAVRDEPKFQSHIESILKSKESLDIEFFKEEIPSAIEQSQEGIKRISTIVQAMKGFSHPGTETPVSADLNELVKNTVIVSTNTWKYISTLEVTYDSEMPPDSMFSRSP